MVFLKIKHFLIFLYILLVCSISLFAGIETRQTAAGYTIDIKLQDLRIDTVLIDGQPFISIDASNCFLEGEPGEPAIPFMSFTTAVSNGSALKFELIELNTRTIKGLPIKPLSVLPPVGYEPENLAPLYYPRNLYPEQQITDGYRDNLLGVPVWRWEYSPVIFDAENNQVKIITRARIRIYGSDAENRFLPVNNNLSRKHYQTLERRIHNYPFLKLTPQIRKSLNIKTSEYDLSSGPWLKMKVDHEGIYKLTYSQAQSAGFPVNDVNLPELKVYSHQ